MDAIYLSPQGKRLVGASSRLMRLATGYFFTEGPVWDSALGGLYFTNFADDTIHLWREGEGARLYRAACYRPVGLTLMADGRVVAAQTRNHAIAYAGPEASETIVDSYEGKRLNSPNDVVARSDGALFFTDPYSTAMGDMHELPFNGVYAWVKGSLTLIDQMQRPNGLAFSPDERILYVNDTNRQLINAYDVDTDGRASLRGAFATLDTAYGPGGPDGMKVDVEGNVYLTGPGGIWALSPQGDPLCILPMPEPPGNLCFGGEGNRTLFFTASTSVYSLQMEVPGIIPIRA